MMPLFSHVLQIQVLKEITYQQRQHTHTHTGTHVLLMGTYFCSLLWLSLIIIIHWFFMMRQRNCCLFNSYLFVFLTLTSFFTFYVVFNFLPNYLNKFLDWVVHFISGYFNFKHITCCSSQLKSYNKRFPVENWKFAKNNYLKKNLSFNYIYKQLK